MKLLQIERDAAQTAAGGHRHRGEAPYAADPVQRAARTQSRTAASGGDRPRDPGLDAAARPAKAAATIRASPFRRASCRTSCARCPTGAEVALDAQNNRLQVKAGKSRFNLQTLPADGFPAAGRRRRGARKVTLPQKALRELLLLVQYRDGAAGHPLLPERHAARARRRADARSSRPTGTA